MTWSPRPIYLPDTHLPRGVETSRPTCRACQTVWPCAIAGEYLTTCRCVCGATTWADTTTPRRWHGGPRCYTDAEAVTAEAAKLRPTHPHYPPSHYYPPKPARPVRQRPAYRHTTAGPGDVSLGTWVWVRPGALHPGWGDIHQLAMVTALGTPKCEVWLILDGTVHQARTDHLTLSTSAAQRAGGGAWIRWSIAQHLAHQAADRPSEPVVRTDQLDLFGAPV